MNPLEACRIRQSHQTGFIHRKDVIPTFENFCFALTLFRTHIGEQIEEGKGLLKRLFAFYSKGFPLYIHEYGVPSTKSHGLRCAVPLFWISKLYEHVISPPLRKEIRSIFDKLTDLEKDSLSPLYQVLFCALRGEEIPYYEAQFSHEWGILLLAYQISGEKASWILEDALKLWNPDLMTYVGPSFQEYQREREPDVTLYDLFMAEHQGETSERLERPHLIHLCKSLIFPFKEKKALSKTNTFSSLTGTKRREWQAKGFHSIRFLFGHKDHLHSFVCQEDLPCVKEEESFLFSYRQEIPDEKKRTELSFYVAHHPDVSLRINGKKETVFHLDEPLEIETPEKKLTLIFSLDKGEGHFMGHISRGNRPSQVALEGSQDFSSYDWKISLRTIHRSEDTVIRLRVL